MPKFQPHELLRAFRAETLKITQAELATATDLHEGYVCQYETGAAKLGPEAGLKIFDAYRPQFVAAGISFELLMREQRDSV